MASSDAEIIIIGGGIGGLTAALELDRVGINPLVLESVSEIKPLGVGISVLPHASIILKQLGLQDTLLAGSISLEASAFYSRFGQLIYREAAGEAAGYPSPQYGIHRGVLQQILLDA